MRREVKVMFKMTTSLDLNWTVGNRTPCDPFRPMAQPILSLSCIGIDILSISQAGREETVTERLVHPASLMPLPLRVQPAPLQPAVQVDEEVDDGEHEEHASQEDECVVHYDLRM